ncbi:hypothetical protein [Clostridium estertheticum]|uniref:Uncharacterized protein n=1 Tax=Clostridium estertheticum subsp. estertheticum TaxID=1552 RepID=A0A1J0GJH1_9CLOT|nr:hypothetical protein [Clostridium estertheticum]APC41062.1 hypothetical protein A7L45_13750 [Clostridium estertheticum subsp. estertheticum]
MDRLPIDFLKFNLQEREYPYFEDDELELLLESNDGDIKKASHQGCILKAAADDKLEVAGIKLSSNREYWLTLAETFNVTAEPGNGYITSMKRVDGW